MLRSTCEKYSIFFSRSYQREALAKSSHFAHEDIQANSGGKKHLSQVHSQDKTQAI